MKLTREERLRLVEVFTQAMLRDTKEMAIVTGLSVQHAGAAAARGAVAAVDVISKELAEAEVSWRETEGEDHDDRFVE